MAVAAAQNKLAATAAAVVMVDLLLQELAELAVMQQAVMADKLAKVHQVAQAVPAELVAQAELAATA